VDLQLIRYVFPSSCGLQKHKDSGADVTVSCVPMDDSRASDYGLMKIDGKGRINNFNEKPKGDDLQSMVSDMQVSPYTCNVLHRF